MTFLDRVYDQALALTVSSDVVAKDFAAVHPDLNEREHVLTIQQGQMPSYGNYGYLHALKDFTRSAWVRKAIVTIYNNFAKLPVYVEDRKSATDTSRVEGHEVAALLNHPNDKISSMELWEQWIVDMFLGGEEGWEMVKNGAGKFIEIWPRQPNHVSIIPDKTRLRYYGIQSYKIDDGLAKAYEIPPEEFVFFKFFNPSNPYRGLSVISAVKMSIVIDQLAQAWSQLFFYNSARPDYAIVAPQGITKTERDDLLKKIKEKVGGISNAHEPLVLESGVTEIKILSFPPKDMEWVEQRQLSRDEIGAIAGVPDILMGFGSDSYDTQEKRTAALRVLFELTIQPLAMYRDTHLTQWFRDRGMLKPTEFLCTDYDDVSALEEKDATEWQEIKDKLALGIMTINQYCEMVGLPLQPWGDVWWAAPNLVPVTSGVVALPSDGSSGGSAAPQGAALRFVGQTKAAIAYGDDQHVKLWDAFEKSVSKNERKLGNTVARIFEEQRDEVIAKLNKSKMIKGQRSKSVQDVIDDPFDKDEWTKETKDRVHVHIEGATDEAGNAALDALKLSISFDLSDPRVSKFIKQREQRFSTRINDTTWQQLSDSLQQGYDAGEALSDLIKRVENVMGDRIASSGEAIARTEIVGDMNGGTREGWQQSGVVDGKGWLASLDDRTRETHVDAHKKYQADPIPLDDDFEVGDGTGPGPGEIDAVEEVVNCRCTLTPVVNQRAYAMARLKEYRIKQARWFTSEQ